jgi:hypothetical protein
MNINSLNFLSSLPESNPTPNGEGKYHYQSIQYVFFSGNEQKTNIDDKVKIGKVKTDLDNFLHKIDDFLEDFIDFY